MNLLQKPILFPLNEKVRLIQYITGENSVLEHVELSIYDVEPGGEVSYHEADLESCLVVLSGKVTVAVSNGETYTDLGTRTSVFDKVPTHSVYIGKNRFYTITAETKARILIAASKTDHSLPDSLIKPEDVLLESRGSYQNRRYVQTILSDQDTVSDKLLVVEVYTEGGNFSSYPPHKHDQDHLPDESFLEETYYHEINPPQGFIFQRIYSDNRLLDQTMSCTNQDVVIVPKGYHPVGVPDGYTSYYLNIMAGPTKMWRFHDDPNHKWIKNRP
ncbi:5-deoxy-glucuronate isomerase [Enterococcus canintestini]|uniref:5-deoxy-glucuronate isomerase n=1 Tax=Enterococcus canintestini TaxID=317010 RepID=UPI00288F2BD9|nr:5-deoxy-glucuronate isomerase [Enterococcus canintestini]MDT2739800.1 5-deoxy-glucuronate isomerase [Enterococcus canintestini]